MKYFKVSEPVCFSDHCPIKFSMKTGKVLGSGNIINIDEFVGLEHSFTWTKDRAENLSRC